MKNPNRRKKMKSLAKLQAEAKMIPAIQAAIAQGDAKKALRLMKCFRTDAEITAENEPMHRDAIEKEAAAATAPKEKVCTMATYWAMHPASRKGWVLVGPNDPRLQK
jgi:hypothetical protein